ncbi:MAG: class F sortase [Acidimicrobiales bacterium]
MAERSVGNGDGGPDRTTRRRTASLLSAVVAAVTVVAGCGQAGGDQLGSSGAPSPQAPATGGAADSGRPTAGSAAQGADAEREAGGAPASGGLTADEVKQAPALPPAADLGELAEDRAKAEVRPLSISIDQLGLDEVAVQAVGVEPTGEMAIPPPKEVGWYRYGPLPGGPGSAVLAGHIASNGIDGAFRHLDRLGPGDLVEVALSDGRRLRFTVTERVQVDKTELPFDQLFARSGPPRLALITCGGEFDYDARSYRDNIVVVAELAPDPGV